MNNSDNGRNRVFLSGKIASSPQFSHEIFGEGFFELTMQVQRLSDVCDALPITVSDRLISQKCLEVGDNISVLGQFRSYNKIVDGKSKLMLTVFVRDIVDEGHVFNPNMIELSGFVCKPPVYRITPFKREICDILLAVNRAYHKSDYIPCISWGRNARFAKSIEVGERVFVTGRIQSREYQKRISEDECETKVAFEISINKISSEEISSQLDAICEAALTIDNPYFEHEIE